MAVAVLEVGHDEAADIVQNTLLRAWRRWETYSPDRGAPRAWLMAVLIDQARRLRVRRMSRFGAADSPDRPAGPVMWVDQTEASSTAVEVRMDVDAAVRSLPRRQRQVVVLYYLADMAVDDVAAVLGIGSGSVKSHLSDARRALRTVGATPVIDDHDMDEQLKAWGLARRERAAEVDVSAIVAHGADRPSWEPATAGLRRDRFGGRPVLIGAAIVLLVAAGGIAVRSLLAQTAHQPATGTTVAPLDAHTLVLHDGDTIRVNGEVLAIPKRPVQLCAPYFDTLDGTTNRFTYCPGSVDVTGVELSALSNRQVRDGTVYGLADLIGTYRAGNVTVTHQAAFTPEPDPPDDRVPCSAPAGGWPTGALNENIDLTAAEQYQHAHPRTIIEIALLRPSPRQAVAYVLTDRDPAPVRAAVTADFGKRLCVTQSKWTRAQLASAQAAMLHQMNGPNTLTSANSVGERLTATAQLAVTVQIPTVSPALADLVDAQPRGIIALDVWLAPQR